MFINKTSAQDTFLVQKYKKIILLWIRSKRKKKNFEFIFFFRDLIRFHSCWRFFGFGGRLVTGNQFEEGADGVVLVDREALSLADDRDRQILKN